MGNRCVIGVDFDNTLVSYDEPIYRMALARGLIAPETTQSKRVVRDTLRRLPQGEQMWQEIQRVVYGAHIHHARVIEGVQAFFAHCRAHHVPVFIISHKTEFPNGDPNGVNLREAAKAWMACHQFFSSTGLGLSPSDVYFESSRQEKIARIRSLGCTHFIDDLEETFLEASFPHEVERILFAAHGPSMSPPTVTTVTTWKEITDYVFGPGR